LVFVSFYVATLIVLLWLRFPFVQWTGLLSVTVATVFTVWIWERGEWQLGLFVPPSLAARELFWGGVWGFGLIAACASLVVLFTDTWHGPGRGFPWSEMITVFVPAAVHEELLFRGYAFQKLRAWRRGFAIVFVALLFAMLHAGNTSVTLLGLTNVFLGGVLLGLAYERYLRLWFPIGLHLAWNVTTGPVLGHEVSGYEPLRSLFVENGAGPIWLTGGEFGIEGSVLMTAVEAAAIVLLAARSGSNIIGRRGVQGGGSSKELVQ
jgi:uncharacterized protein